MLNLNQMGRWVEREGHQVEFGNIVGPFVGKPYKYLCKTIEGAIEFEKYCNQRDPANTNMPIAVTEEIAARFGAVSLT